MTGTGQGTWRLRSGRRVAVIWAAGAVVAAVIAVMAVTAGMRGPVSRSLASSRAAPAPPQPAPVISRIGQASVPLTDVSATPAGWVPVPFGSAQLSVPGSWLVEGPVPNLWCASDDDGGMIFAGIEPRFPKWFGCGPTASVAWIVPAGQLPRGITYRRPTAVIHGIAVYRLPAGEGSVLYLVPELGVQVGARGRLAERMLATLTSSPLAVVLSRGAAAPRQPSWTWRQFGGLRFATPRSWGPQRADQWAICGTGVAPGSLQLIDAVKPPLAMPCAFGIPYATDMHAQPGLTVVTGKYADQSVGQDYASCQPRRGLQICASTITGQGGFLSAVLIFSVSRPHHAPVLFLLGLSGSGASARTIFASISAAGR